MVLVLFKSVPEVEAVLVLSVGAAAFMTTLPSCCTAVCACAAAGIVPLFTAHSF